MKIKDLEIYPFGELIDRYAISKKVHYSRSPIDRNIPRAIMGYSHPKIRDYISIQTTPRFVLNLKNAQIHHNPHEKSAMGAVLISENLKIVKSDYIDYQHWDTEPFLWSARFSDMEIVNPREVVLGKTLYLSTLWWHSYYHFHVDVLGKLFTTLSIVDKDFFDGFDHIILPNITKQFMVDMLKKLNLLHKVRIEPSQPIRYEDISIPSAAANLDGYIPRDLIDFIYSNFSLTTHSSRKLYISRSDAHHRRVINETEIINILIPNGFEIVTLEGKSFSEQVALFASANVIVAPHGAGLTNLLYCNQSTKLYEFFSTDYVNKCFTEMSAEKGIDYYYSVFPGTQDPKMDYRIDLSALKEFLEIVN